MMALIRCILSTRCNNRRVGGLFLLPQPLGIGRISFVGNFPRQSSKLGGKPDKLCRLPPGPCPQPFILSLAITDRSLGYSLAPSLFQKSELLSFLSSINLNINLNNLIKILLTSAEIIIHDTTHGHCNLETEFAQWDDSVKSPT